MGRQCVVTFSPTPRVAANVRAEMARRRVSQESLAAALGMSQASVSRRLTNITPFTADELSKVAAHLDLPVAVLWGETAVAS